jgi:hypothetical protein
MNNNSNGGDPISAIKAQASKQHKPLKRNGEDSVLNEFFAVVSKVRKVSDRLKLENKITMTNFVMFGPQSVGKT